MKDEESFIKQNILTYSRITYFMHFTMLLMAIVVSQYPAYASNNGLTV